MYGHLLWTFLRKGSKLPTRRLLYGNGVKLAALQVVLQRELMSGLTTTLERRYGGLLHRLLGHVFIKVANVSGKNGGVVDSTRVIGLASIGLRVTASCLGRIVSVLRKAHLVAFAMGDSELATRYLRGGIESGTTVLQVRVKAMNVRSAGRTSVGAVLTIMITDRNLHNTLALVVTKTYTSHVSVTPMKLSLQVSWEVAMGLEYENVRGLYLYLGDGLRGVRRTSG